MCHQDTLVDVTQYVKRIKELEQQNSELTSDYFTVLDYVTDDLISKTNTRLEAVYKMISNARESHCKEIYVDEIQEDLETIRIQLATCGVIANSNTEESLGTNRDISPKYMCDSIQNVIDAVQRELDLRSRIDELTDYIEDSKHVMMVVASCDTKESANVIADKWIESCPKYN